jgi:hypothetical protein
VIDKPTIVIVCRQIIIGGKKRSGIYTMIKKIYYFIDAKQRKEGKDE